MDFHFGVRIADDIEGDLHGLGGGLQRQQFLLLFLGDFKIGEHLCLLLVEDLPPLLVEHLARTLIFVEGLLVVSDGEVSGGRVGAAVLEAGAVGLVHNLLLGVLLLCGLLFLCILGIVHLLFYLSWRVLLKSSPDVGLRSRELTLRV